MRTCAYASLSELIDVFTGIDGVCVRCVTLTRLGRTVTRGVSVPRYGALWREVVHCKGIISAVSFFGFFANVGIEYRGCLGVSKKKVVVGSSR